MGFSILLAGDVLDGLAPYLTPRAVLLLSMTNRHLNASVDHTSIWVQIYNTFYRRPFNHMPPPRAWVELEKKPNDMQIAQHARRLCGLLEFTGC